LRQGSPLRRAERGIHADVAEAQITRMARGYESVGHYRRKRTSIAMMAGNQMERQFAGLVIGRGQSEMVRELRGQELMPKASR
jgi:hypothetical protein